MTVLDLLAPPHGGLWLDLESAHYSSYVTTLVLYGFLPIPLRLGIEK